MKKLTLDNLKQFRDEMRALMRTGVELEYAPIAGAVRHGARPPRLPRLPRES